MNNLSEKENNDNENLPNCKYRDISYFSNLDGELKSKCLSFLHLNINSLPKNFDNFNHLINKLKLEFDILCISESRILKSQSLNTNVSSKNYVIEQTSTKSTAGGALLYINKRHSYKTRPDFAIYKPKKLESIFVEVVLPKKSNLIVGCIYKHPCMDICTFNDHYLNPLLDNLSKEANKTAILLGDFNTDFLNFDTSEHVSKFLDDLASNSLQPQILLPTRISNNSKTLIDNIFVIYQTHWSKVPCLETSHQVYRIIFHNSIYYQNSFQIPLQLNIALYPMTGKNLTTSHFLKILKKLIGI